LRALLKEILADPKAMALAVLVHVVLAGLLIVSLEWTSVPMPSQPKVDIVKAVTIDEKKIQAELEKIKQAEDKKKKKEKTAEKKARDLEKKRKLEEQRLAKLRKEQEAEKKSQMKLAQEKEAKEKELERIKSERLAQEKALADAEAKQKAEAIAREQAALDAERQKQLSSLRGQYIADITNKVERNWIKPASARQGLSCVVNVKQIPGGEVIDVRVTRCIGDEVFRRSVETAVRRSSPLPVPPDPSVFDREIEFNFKPTYK